MLQHPSAQAQTAFTIKAKAALEASVENDGSCLLVHLLAAFVYQSHPNQVG